MARRRRKCCQQSTDYRRLSITLSAYSFANNAMGVMQRVARVRLRQRRRETCMRHTDAIIHFSTIHRTEGWDTVYKLPVSIPAYAVLIVAVSRVRRGESTERRHRRHRLRASHGRRLRQVRSLARALQRSRQQQRRAASAIRLNRQEQAALQANTRGQ